MTHDASERSASSATVLTVVVPSLNECDNVAALVEGLEEVLNELDCEILYVDDSVDDTAVVVRRLALTSDVKLRVLRRDEPRGGLAGAICDGLREANGTYVVVMEGALRHPPGLVPMLLRTAQSEQADLVVASRYCGQGDASGLSTSWRLPVSSMGRLLARSCFPRRVGRVCSDPTAGFFCVRRDAVDLDRLRPRGLKILLEILARHDLRVSEVPFIFGTPAVGQTRASWQNRVTFLRQLATLRLGRLSRFAAVGALGAFVNLAVMWICMRMLGLHYLFAAALATEVSILHNFLVQERFVFGDMRDGRHSFTVRMAHFFAFNNAEMIVRMPVLALLVSGLGVLAVPAQALTIAAAFLLRFLWVTQVVYRPRPSRQGKESGLAAPQSEPLASDGIDKC